VFDVDEVLPRLMGYALIGVKWVEWGRWKESGEKLMRTAQSRRSKGLEERDKRMKCEHTCCLVTMLPVQIRWCILPGIKRSLNFSWIWDSREGIQKSPQMRTSYMEGLGRVGWGKPGSITGVDPICWKSLIRDNCEWRKGETRRRTQIWSGGIQRARFWPRIRSSFVVNSCKRVLNSAVEWITRLWRQIARREEGFNWE